MHGNIGRRAAKCNPHVAFIDKVTFRYQKGLTEKQMRLLREHARSVNQRYGHPIRGEDAAFLLTIVAPNDTALTFLAKRRKWICNYIEIALDIVTPDNQTAVNLVDLFDRHFVQPWHGKAEVHAEENGSYTRRNAPGIRYVWYGDRPSKITNGPCLHLEARAHGVAAVRRIGIYHPRDLLTFDHAAFWAERLKLYRVDCERLGRWWENKELNERRQHPDQQQYGKFSYNADARRGAVIYRVLAETEEFRRHCAVTVCTDPECEELPVDQFGRPCRIIDRSMQQLVKVIGRGPWLLPFDILCYVRQSMLLVKTPDTQGEMKIPGQMKMHGQMMAVTPAV